MNKPIYDPINPIISHVFKTWFPPLGQEASFHQLLRTSGSGIPTELSTKKFQVKKILTHPTCSSLYSSEEASMSVSFDSSSWIRAAVLPGLS